MTSAVTRAATSRMRWLRVSDGLMVPSCVSTVGVGSLSDEIAELTVRGFTRRSYAVSWPPALRSRT